MSSSSVAERSVAGRSTAESSMRSIVSEDDTSAAPSLVAPWRTSDVSDELGAESTSGSRVVASRAAPIPHDPPPLFPPHGSHGLPGPPSEAPTVGSSVRSKATRDSIAYLSQTPIEDYVAKYQVIKSSWRGKYERIFALGPTRFCTIDPKDFEVTNTWPLTSLLNITLEQGDEEGFVLHLKGSKKDEQLKLRCRFRSHLLSDVYRLQERCLPQRTSVQQFECSKLLRTGAQIGGVLEINKDCITLRNSDGDFRSTYRFVEMEHLSLASDAKDAFIIGYRGRPRLFFSDRRQQILSQIQSAAEKIGMRLAQRNGLNVAGVSEERRLYGQDVGKPFVRFAVQKLTPKYSIPVERTLSLHQKHIVESDQDGGVVSCLEYRQIYVLLRSPKNANNFDVQFLNGSTTQYVSSDRDGVLAAIYDLCVTCNENPELFITSIPNERGLRLLPCFATEDQAETHSFFGDTSIGICFMQRMTAVAKIGQSHRASNPAFIEITQEFNANVPASGILYDTKHSIVADALRPISTQLYLISKASPIASQSAIALLQALFRIATSFYGFREVAQVNHLGDSLTNLVLHGDEFVVFWVTLLLNRLTIHKTPSSTKLDAAAIRSCEQVEAQNKTILLGNSYLIQSLVTHLDGVDVKGMKLNPQSVLRRRVGPLVIMGMLQLLEGSLCSRRQTTAPEDFQVIVSEVAKYYGTLLKTLFQSRCATTVEACTLLLKSILEECASDVATQIRNTALIEGIVLRHFYQAIFDSSFDQRSVSRYLISLWMSHHTSSKDLLARMLPRGFLNLLSKPFASLEEMHELDELEREQGVGSLTNESRLSLLSDESSVFDMDMWSLPADRENDNGLSMGRIASRASFENTSALAALQQHGGSSSLMFESRTSIAGAANSSTRDSMGTQIENEYTKSRMLQKMQSSVTMHSQHGELQSDGVSDSRLSLRDLLPRQSMSAADGTGLTGSRVRKRDLAYNFVANAVTKSKSERFVPMKMKKSSRHKSKLYEKDNRAPENFRLLFHMIGRDHENVELIWNVHTRTELKRALLYEIQRFSSYQNGAGQGSAIWNHEDFCVRYESLAHELTVGGCYVRLLCELPSKSFTTSMTGSASNLFPSDFNSDCENSSLIGSKISCEDQFSCPAMEVVNVSNPQSLVEHLYRRILRENIRAEHHDEIKTSIDCIQGLRIVGGAFASVPGATDLDEVGYLFDLIKDTIHAPVLESLLQAVRALCMSKANSRRLLETESIVDIVVHLLQLGHIAGRTARSGTPNERASVWRLRACDSETFGGASTVTELQSTMSGVDIKTCQVERVSDVVCVASYNGIGGTYLLENMQLRWELAMKGDVNPEQIAHDAVNILLSIAYSSSLMECPDKAHHSNKGALFPVLRSKVVLWNQVRRIIPLLARFQSPQLCMQAAKLLNFLFLGGGVHLLASDDVTNRARLNVWGLFYMAFVTEFSSFDEVAELLKSTHLFQDGIVSGSSALRGILPDAMIRLLEQASPGEFSATFSGSCSSPEVIWNQDMLAQLRANCKDHLEDYLEILQEDVSSEWKYCPMAPVTYGELDEELWCSGVYLNNFCEQFEFRIDIPLEFTNELMHQWRAETNRRAARYKYEEAAELLGVEFTGTARDQHEKYRAGFKDSVRRLQVGHDTADVYNDRLADFHEAFGVLTSPRPSLLTEGHDPVNLLLILNALVEMCNRYPTELEHYAFDCYDLLLPLLNTYCTASGVAAPATSNDQCFDIAVCAAELLYNSCAVSVQNSEILLRQPDLATLERVVAYCVNAMVKDPIDHDIRLERVCFFLLQTVTGLVASPSGRMWIFSTNTLMFDMVRILWLWNHSLQKSFLRSKIIQQVLESASRMAVREVNQQRLLEHGILWQLLLLFSPQYNVDLDDSAVRARLRTSIKSPDDDFMAIADEIQNLLSVMAVRCLCRLGGFASNVSELVSPKNHDMVVAAMNSLLTPNLAKLLRLDSHHEFLKIFHSDCESYTLFWNAEMRKEMLDFIKPFGDAEPSLVICETYADAVKFRFEYLGMVFAIGDLYVNTLIASLEVLQQTELQVPADKIGLTTQFFAELFGFIDTGKLGQVPNTTYTPVLPGSASPVSLPPHSGWKLPRSELETTLRVTALNCLAVACEVVPNLVESYVVDDLSVIKMILRMLFPPENEVHERDGDDNEESLVFSDDLYVSARYHCLTLLCSLAKCDRFGRASHEVGICDILIEVVHLCRDIGPMVIAIIENLCHAAARAEFISDILQTGSYIEFIGWLVGVEEAASEEEIQMAEDLKTPCAKLLAEMMRPGGALGHESTTALSRFLPIALCDQLTADPAAFVTFYRGDHATPELVWNDAMRTHLQFNLVEFLNEYYSAESPSESDGAEPSSSIVATFTVDYRGVYPHPMTGNVYLSLFMINPTFQLRDPLYFVCSLWEEFQQLFGELSRLTSDLRMTRSPDDDMTTQQHEGFLDLVTACMVCVLRVNPWVLDTMADAKIPEKCCAYLTESTRSHYSVACVISVIRLLRVFSMSKICVATLQPMCSGLFTCLLAHMSPSHQGVLHRESAYTLEIIRRVIANFPNNISNGEGVVTIAMRLDLFGYLLNLLENPGSMGSVSQPHVVRAIAIDILRMLETDRLQSKAAHDFLKKNKRWEKKFRHEATAIPVPGNPEDPFLVNYSPDIDQMVAQHVSKAPAAPPQAALNTHSNPNGIGRESLTTRYRSPAQAHTTRAIERESYQQSDRLGKSEKKGARFKTLFSRDK